MGWWSSDIPGGDSPLDTLGGLCDGSLGGSGVRDRETRDLHHWATFGPDSLVVVMKRG